MTSRRLFLPAAALVAGCMAETPTVPVEPMLPEVPSGAVQAVVRQAAGTEPGTTVFTIHVIGGQLAVASFQGAILFDPGDLQVLSVTTPTGAGGETRIVNDLGLAQGQLRFAAFTPTAFASTEAFVVTTRLRGATADLRVRLDAVGTSEGTEVVSSALLPSALVRD